MKERNPKGKKTKKQKKNLLLYDPFCPQGEINESCELVIDGSGCEKGTFLSRSAVFVMRHCVLILLEGEQKRAIKEKRSVD